MDWLDRPRGWAHASFPPCLVLDPEV
jgi:hypothetical protein